MDETLADCLREISKQIGPERPIPGRRVRIEEGKRRGAEGVVLHHILDRFNGWKWRYKDSAQATLQEMTGRYGYRVKVRSEIHGDFWIDAEKVTVIPEVSSDF